MGTRRISFPDGRRQNRLATCANSSLSAIYVALIIEFDESTVLRSHPRLRAPVQLFQWCICAQSIQRVPVDLIVVRHLSLLAVLDFVRRMARRQQRRKSFIHSCPAMSCHCRRTDTILKFEPNSVGCAPQLSPRLAVERAVEFEFRTIAASGRECYSPVNVLLVIEY